MALSNQFTVLVLYLPPFYRFTLHEKKLFLQVIHHLFFGQRIYKLSKKSQQQNKLRNVPIVNEIPPWFSKSPNVELNLMGNLTTKAMSMTSISKISYRYNQCTKIFTDGSMDLRLSLIKWRRSMLYIPESGSLYYVSTVVHQHTVLIQNYWKLVLLYVFVWNYQKLATVF